MVFYMRKLLSNNLSSGKRKEKKDRWKSERMIKVFAEANHIYSYKFGNNIDIKKLSGELASKAIQG